MTRRLLLVMAVFLASFSGIHCFPAPGQDGSDRKANKPPTIQITAGVVDSAEVDYRIDFAWQGYDDDGSVTAYEYAIDDTTLEETWQWIEETGKSFKFQAPIPSDDPEDPRSFGWHRFFIRAVDDDEARSSIDYRFFNAKTIAPETRITGVERQGCRTFLYRWEGEDLDASDPELNPEFYEYKLVHWNLGEDPIEALLTGENLLLEDQEGGDGTWWIRVSSETKEALIEGQAIGAILIFGVRAIDEAGAVEPSLEVGENYLPFEVTAEECQPLVTVLEGMSGAHTFPNEGEIWNLEVNADHPIQFSWIADFSHCGGRIGSVNYGFDIPDPGDEN
ncbi:MAG: hypothetical protein KJ927_09780, partial [Candidatus Eisenbacteria bacterium]|nr:hypothetical protein [Candidatus Eisenbacteria bacterium]